MSAATLTESSARVPATPRDDLAEPTGESTAATPGSGLPGTAPRPTDVVQRLALALAGLVLTAIGTPLLLRPGDFYGMELLTDQLALASDLRASGGTLLAFGVLLLGGAAFERLSAPAALAGTVLYLAYAASRLVAIGLDGVPPDFVLAAAVVEAAIGGLLAWSALRSR